MASKRNKTITLNTTEIELFSAEALRPEMLPEGFAPDRLCLGNMEAVCPLLPRESVSLAIVDPPYNLSKHYGESDFHHKNDEDYRAFTVSWIEKLLPLLKKNATVYVCSDWKTSLLIAPILARYFHIQNRITWQREKGRGAAKNYKNAMEDIWFCTLSDDYTFHTDRVKLRRRVLAPYRENGKAKDWKEGDGTPYRDTCPSNFWDDITIPYWSMEENTPHPTQKPEKLLAKLILASSEEGDLVFDPFLGSGSSAVTAKKLNRRFFGIEREREYIALAIKRLRLADRNKRIQGYEDGIFYHRNYKPNHQ